MTQDQKLMENPTKKKTKWKSTFTSYLFILPALSFLVTFALYPIVYLIYLSLFKYRLPNPPVFIGFANYARVLQDGLFWKSMMNTAIYTVGSSALGLTFALAIAVFLNRQFKGRRFFKVLYFLPTVTSEVITAMIFMWIFNNDLGILNYLLKSSGVSNPPAWLLQPGFAMGIIILVGAWRGVSYNIPIYLAALESLPKSISEAAEIDGANGWQRFVHITIPSITPTIVYTVVMAIIGSFQVVAIVDVLTNGGPRDTTLVAIKYIWQQAFEFNKLGYGATLSLFIFPILFGITYLQLKLSEGRDK